MLIRYLPLLAALAPLLAVNIAYWLGVNHDHLPACFPYVDGCTSISATGRNPPGSFLFRAVHMPLSVLLVVIWYFAAAWLRSLCNDAASRWSNWIIGCGTLGAAALILYVTFLGTTEPFYEFMRRIGIYFYFLGTALAQLLVTLQFKRCCAANARSLAQAMLWFCLLPFGLGVLNLILKAIPGRCRHEREPHRMARGVIDAVLVPRVVCCVAADRLSGRGYHGFDQRSLVSTFSSVRDSRNASRSALSLSLSSKPLTNSDLNGLTLPSPANGPFSMRRPPLA